jgi:flagellin-specific chaperone FliS
MNYYTLNATQQKVINAVSKSERRTPEQVVSMLLDQGLDFFYCEHQAMYSPYVNSETFDKALNRDIKRTK